MKQIKKNQSFVQWFVSLFVILFLGIGSILFSLGIVFAASGVNSHGVANLSASTAGNGGTWTSETKKITGVVAVKATSGCTGTSYSSQTATLTLKNNYSNPAILYFDVALSGGGSVSADKGEIGSNYSYSLLSGEQIVISISSGSTQGSDETAEFYNISLSEVVPVTVTFLAPQNGSYTVENTPITETTEIYHEESSTPYNVVATPANGYKFYAWKNITQNSILSTNASDSLLLTSNCTIQPLFVTSTTPVFGVETQLFDNLNNAITYAVNNNKGVIFLEDDGELPAGSYTIPNGKTLLIPYDNAHTVKTTTNNAIYNQYARPFAFKTLTMANGAIINVSNGGAISVGSQMSSKGQMGGQNGTPTGPHGKIIMEAGSKIEMNSGSNLYCWGYITGSGRINANSGSTVYEMFQITGWRGGSATSSIASYAFPFNQYYIQNIESEIYFYKGAEEKLCSAVNASSRAYDVKVTLIGSNGMFMFGSSANSNDYVMRRYDNEHDRQKYIVAGDVSLSKMTVTGLPMIGSVSTEDYTLPLTNNMDITIADNSTVNLSSQDFAMLPGSSIRIENGSTLNIQSGSNLYLYDSDDWIGNKFAGSADFHPIPYTTYSYTTINNNKEVFHYSTYERTTANSIVDAKINVLGTLFCTGCVYTSGTASETTKGADICSTYNVNLQENGKVVLASGNIPTNKQTSSIKEMANNSTETTIQMILAKLHNGDGSYYSTIDHLSGQSSAQTIAYGSDDMWGGSSGGEQPYNLTFVDPRYPNFKVTYTAYASQQFPFPTKSDILSKISSEYLSDPNYNSNAFKNGNNEILRWDAAGTLYIPGQPSEGAIGLLNTIEINPWWCGWIVDNGNYYFAKENTSINPLVYYTSGLFPAFSPSDSNDTGLYKFKDDSTWDMTYTDLFVFSNEIYNIEYGVVKGGIGLKESSGYLYYILEDGTAFKDGTIFIPDDPNKLNDYYVNGIQVESGLYYFGPNGHMFYGNSLIDDEHPFVEITSGITQGGGN